MFADRARLRRLALKIAVLNQVFTTPSIVRGIQCLENIYFAGSYGDVLCGMHGVSKVAVKRLCLPSSWKLSLRKQAIYRESLLWSIAIHDHVVPFLGISEDPFDGALCMVSPWMDNGSVLQRWVSRTSSTGSNTLAELRQLHQSVLGLAYLHEEGIVHGDLHAGNILIDEVGNARLADFGLSLLAEATHHEYGSIHGGGGSHWKAPELFTPEEFGLSSYRPTFMSDIFAFACTCFEVYAGEPPLAECNQYQIGFRVLKGERDPRPSVPGGELMHESMWSLVQSCWGHDPSSRPSAASVAETMSRITGQIASVEMPSPPPSPPHSRPPSLPPSHSPSRSPTPPPDAGNDEATGESSSPYFTLVRFNLDCSPSTYMN
ncbi:kinase-like domain-containing protein [Cristinia sonorae]|uniref:Kinase-like domain-containing protein n=1 Tax=Cristinia sonorae TaxID=1940300 RepID=A0A8K0XQD1_9AGAR|nr:kinase-like domain-containing protein [Cristinia sonorae]